LQDAAGVAAVGARAVHTAALDDGVAHGGKRQVALACQRSDPVLQLQWRKGRGLLNANGGKWAAKENQKSRQTTG
jgi:hypothetical protein